MNPRIVLGLIFIGASFSIWSADQLIKGQKDIVTYKGEVDLNSSDTSLLSGGTLNIRSVEAPGSRAVGVFTLDGEKIIGLADDKHWPIASLTKLMTAFVAFDEFRVNKSVTITKEMIDRTDGSAGDFKEGEVYSVADLEKALLVVSNNTAAEALASIKGRERFLALMNEYCKRFGLKNTRFADPTGLSIENQSTVQDMAQLVKYILINQPGVFSVSRQSTTTITDLVSGKPRELKNIHQFAGRADFIGGKTGTTPEAVGNLISVFHGTKIGEGFIIILLGTEDRFNETQKLLRSAHAITGSH